MTTHLENAFTVDGWEEREDELPAVPDGPATGRALIRKTYRGTLDATAVAEFMSTGQVAYLAQERVEGTLDGRRGSFVLQHGASMEPPSQWAFVVAGSGTGELAGLAGTGRVAHELLVLDYTLDAAAGTSST